MSPGWEREEEEMTPNKTKLLATFPRAIELIVSLTLNSDTE